MATIADAVAGANTKLDAIDAKLDTVLAAIVAIPGGSGGTTDLTPVLDAVADVRAQLSPTV